MSSGYSQLKQGIYLIRLNFRVTNVAVCDITVSYTHLTLPTT